MDFLSEIFRHPLISLSFLGGLIALQCALMRSLAPAKGLIYTAGVGALLFGLVLATLSNSWSILAALPLAAVICLITYLVLSLNFHFKRPPQGRWGNISRKTRLWLAAWGSALIFCAFFGMWINRITSDFYPY